MLLCRNCLVVNRLLHNSKYAIAGTSQVCGTHTVRGVHQSALRGNEWNQRAASDFDVLGAWNNRIKIPKVDIEQSIRSGHLVPKVSLENVGSHSLKGRRMVNEDRFHVCQLSPQLLMFAVYDGHGGAAAADFVAEHMDGCIQSHLETGERDLQKVLKAAFHDCNEAFASYIDHHTEGKEIMSSGCTAVVGLLHHSNELVVAHVGDSKALMCRLAKVVRLTQDHKPEDYLEKERIRAAGGFITTSSMGSPRVNGRLNMTRSLGDLDLKPVGVTSEPTTRSIEVNHSKDAFLVLSTDGISNVISDQEIVDVIASCKTPLEAAATLTDHAVHVGTEDNVTALVIPFGSWGKYDNVRGAVPFSFSRNVVGARFA